MCCHSDVIRGQRCSNYTILCSQMSLARTAVFDADKVRNLAEDMGGIAKNVARVAARLSCYPEFRSALEGRTLSHDFIPIGSDSDVRSFY